MPEYLFFRPPRRQPRILAASSFGRKLALVVSDPWELRYVAEMPLPRKAEARLDQCQVLLQETILRERPQVLVTAASRSTVRRAAKSLVRHFGLTLVELSSRRWKHFVGAVKTDPEARLPAFFSALPERHVSKRLFQNRHLLKTALLSHAALSILSKNAYGKQCPSRNKPWHQPKQESSFMTENQRKLLFRQLYSRGMEGDAAFDYLLKELHVTSLKDVSRRAASDLIDKLMKENGRGNGSHAEANHAS